MWQNKLHIYIHLVWGTRDRLPLITPENERRIYRYIEAVCDRYDCAVLAIGGMPDHVHLLVKLSSTATIADIVKQIKGGSSRLLMDGSDRDFEWQRGYGAFSVSPRHKDQVIAYIRNQKHHHGDHTLWPEAEEWQEPVSRRDTQPERSEGSTGATSVAADSY